MRILLHNLDKVLWINKIDIFFCYCYDEILSSMKGQTDLNLVSSC